MMGAFISIRADRISSGSAKFYRYQRGAAIPPLNRACYSGFRVSPTLVMEAD